MGQADQFWADSRLGATASNITLGAGLTYRVTVQGTWTVWDEGYQYTENQPVMFHSPGGPGDAGGDAAFDPEIQWGNLADSLTPPIHAPGLHFSTDNGATVAHPEPIGGHPTAYTADHSYTYLVTGGGHPLWVSVNDVELSDNNGMLLVTIYGTIPPLRQHPRSDGRGMSTVRRVHPPARSVQGSLRRHGTGSHL